MFPFWLIEAPQDVRVLPVRCQQSERHWWRQSRCRRSGRDEYRPRRPRDAYQAHHFPWRRSAMHSNGGRGLVAEARSPDIGEPPRRGLGGSHASTIARGRGPIARA